MKKIVVLLIVLATPGVGQDGLTLSPEQLAFCLDQDAQLDGMDAEIETLTSDLEKLSAARSELRLRVATLRDTARVDARAEVQLIALRTELDAAETARRQTRVRIGDIFVNRRQVEFDYARLCVGKAYTDDDLTAADALRRPEE